MRVWILGCRIAFCLLTTQLPVTLNPDLMLFSVIPSCLALASQRIKLVLLTSAESIRQANLASSHL